MSILYTDSPDGIYRLRTASIDHFDGEYYARARAMWSDPRVRGRYYVMSGSRSRAHQAALYAAFRAGVGNPANAPGTSLHEWSGNNGAKAMDIHPVSGKGGTYGELHKIGAEYGFHFPFANRAKNPEDWHAELRPGRGPIPPLTKEQAMTLVIEPVGSTTREQGGGWVFGSRGHVYAFEGAPSFKNGNWDEKTRADKSRRCVALVATADGEGYWLVSNRGEVFAYGTATYTGNYQTAWGPGAIVGAYRNSRQPNGGLTLVRDDGKNLNLYRLPTESR